MYMYIYNVIVNGTVSCIKKECSICMTQNNDIKIRCNIYKTRGVKTSHCGLVVMTLAWNARDPGSIPGGGKF